MNYNDLTKELGISIPCLLQIEAAGLIPSANGSSGAHSYTDEEVKLIRRFALLRMLSFSVQDLVDVNTGKTEFTAMLTRHVSSILNDSDNISQAAIVMQNMKREGEDFFEFDPLPYLTHVKELKHNGGIFYDVNTSLLPREGYTNSYNYGRKKTQNSWYVQGSDDPNAQKPDSSYGPTGSFMGDSSDKKRSADDILKNYGKDDSKSGETDTPEAENAEASKASDGHASDNEAKTKDNPFGNPFINPYGRSYEEYSGNPYFKTEEEKKKETPGICPRPFRRYLARTVDIAICSLLINLILVFVFKTSLSLTDITMLSLYPVYLLNLATEPLMISKFGTTPGKWLMGIKIVNLSSQEKLTVKQAYIRSLMLTWYGMGAFIPIFSLIREVLCFRICKDGYQLPWDSDIDIKMTDQRGWRIAVAIITAIVLSEFESVISYNVYIPSNRGKITEAQFYDNCYELIYRLGYTGDMPDFKLTSSGGYLKEVRLEYEPGSTTVSRANEMELGYLAFAASAEGSNCFTLAIDDMFSALYSPASSYEYNYSGVNVRNIIITDELQSPLQNNYDALVKAMLSNSAMLQPYNGKQTYILSKP